MKTNNYSKELKYISAKKRVEDLKGFYIHFSVYIMVNLFISITKIVNEVKDGEAFNEVFLEFGTFAVWFFWGIGVVSHALKVFGFPFLVGKNWEERKINQYMNEN